MLEGLKKYFRRKALARYSSGKETGFMPLSRISSAAVLINVDSPSFEECKEIIIQYFKSRSIKLEFYFLDFRKLEKNELLLTSIQNTFIRKDINWYGRPDKNRFEQIVKQPVDLLVSLVDNDCFANELICSSISASFKIGSRVFLSHPFNMVFTAQSDVENFRNITAMLEKITD